MLPVFTTKSVALSQAVVAAVTALAIALPAAPALAWGQRERDTLTGAAGALLIENVIRNSRQAQARVIPSEYTPQALHGYDEPEYTVERYQEPEYRARRQHNEEYRSHRHGERSWGQRSSVYSTAAATTFNSYDRHERRRIQRKLAWLGYYTGGIDGSFGPGTYAAIMAYANAQGQGAEMRATSTAYVVYDSLLY